MTSRGSSSMNQKRYWEKKKRKTKKRYFKLKISGAIIAWQNCRAAKVGFFFFLLFGILKVEFIKMSQSES